MTPTSCPSGSRPTWRACRNGSRSPSASGRWPRPGRSRSGSGAGSSSGWRPRCLAITTMGGLGLLYEQRQRRPGPPRWPRWSARPRRSGTWPEPTRRTSPDGRRRWPPRSRRRAWPLATPRPCGSSPSCKSRSRPGPRRPIETGPCSIKLVDIRSAKADDPDGSETDAAYAGAFHDAGLDLAALPPAEAGAKIKARPPGVALATGGGPGRLGGRAPGPSQTTRPGPAVWPRWPEWPTPTPGATTFAPRLDQPDKDGPQAALQALAGSAKFEELGAVSLDLLGNALADVGRPGDGRDSAASGPVSAIRATSGSTMTWPGSWSSSTAATRPSASTPPPAPPSRDRPRAGPLRWSARASPTRRSRCSGTSSRLRPKMGSHVGCLGGGVERRGRSKEAAEALEPSVAALREAIRLKPDDARPTTTSASPWSTREARRGGRRMPRGDPAQARLRRWPTTTSASP